VAHGLQVSESRSGTLYGRQWRDASGWFSYTLKVETGVPQRLLATYYGDERDRNFDVLVNDHPIASVALEGGQRDRFIDVAYELPEELLRSANDGRITVKFAAKPKSRTASLFGVRVVRD
jgi:hypothetical protein